MRRYGDWLSLANVVLSATMLASPVTAEPTFRRIDLSRFADLAEWTADRKATLDVVAYENRNPAHFVAVQVYPDGDLSEAYVLVSDAEGRVLRVLPSDEFFGQWQFVGLSDGHVFLAISSAGGAHIWEHLIVYPLASDGIPEQPIFDVMGAAVEVRQGDDRITITRHFDKLGGGASEARNVYRWNGQQFAYDAQLSNWPEVAGGETMVDGGLHTTETSSVP